MRLWGRLKIQVRILCFVDHTHPTATEFVGDFVVGDLIADHSTRDFPKTYPALPDLTPRPTCLKLLRQDGDGFDLYLIGGIRQLHDLHRSTCWLVIPEVLGAYGTHFR